MNKKYSILYNLAIALAILLGLPAAATFAVAMFKPVVDALPKPLERLGGVIVSEDCVFVASWYDGRVYKCDFDGNVIDIFVNRGPPIWITQRDDAIIVHYSGREYPIDQSAFRVRDPGGAAAEVKRTWWGHPMLVVHHANGETSSAPLQPWYVTMIQTPYPGMLWFAIAVGLVVTATWARKRSRLQLARDTET